jgi:hypothetical protein
MGYIYYMHKGPITRDTGCIYFIGADEIRRVKIGRAYIRTVINRLNSFRIGCPVELRVLGLFPTMYSVDEAATHDKFAHLRVRGEWFSWTDEIDAFIAKECRPEWLTLMKK